VTGQSEDGTDSRRGPRGDDSARADPGPLEQGRLDMGILPELIGYHLRRAQVAVFQNFVQAMAGVELTPGQFGVLQVISRNPGLSQTELGNAIGIDRSTVVAVIDKLESRDFVVRAPSPTDRRSYALRLSERGTRLLADLERRVRAHDEAIAQGLSSAERRTLIGLLERLAR
jgi:DNA-binding MarR family transcriptional regulator